VNILTLSNSYIILSQTTIKRAIDTHLPMFLLCCRDCPVKQVTHCALSGTILQWLVHEPAITPGVPPGPEVEPAAGEGEHDPVLAAAPVARDPAELLAASFSPVGFDRYGHTDTDTDIVIPIYSKLIPMPILPSRIYIKPIPIPISGSGFKSNR
jgi:hypothetical protein